MKVDFRISLAIASLALAALACQALGGGGGTSPITTQPPDSPTLPVNPTDAPSGGDVIMSDDFSSSGWGTGTDADSSVEYASGALQMIVFTKNYFVWSTPDNEDYRNVHMEVTVLNNDTDSTTAFGLMCHQQPEDDNSFYYFAMTPAGEYAIAKAVAGEQDLFLTNDDQWASSDSIARSASSYRVGADCGEGRLTLYVDGQEIASVSDSSYTTGGVAVFTWSGEEATSTNVSFDDFEMRELQ